MNGVERPRSLSRLTAGGGVSESDAEYTDANENITYGDSLDLLDTIAETQITLNLFLNNKFELAEERMVQLYCERLMMDETLWMGRDYRVREHFEAGVLMGLGTFNLMLSTLPSKVLRLLEVVGFSGDRGAVILFLRARLLLVSGDIDSAIYCFNRSIESQQDYKQFHHVAYWELLFAHCYVGEWVKAANYAKRLLSESRWSRCVYTYLLCILFAADTTLEESKRDETVAALARESELTDFTHLPPNAIYELALLRIADGDREEAEVLLAKARSYKGFPLENKLHFRIHGAMENLGTRTPMV
ncbi:tetratricopeptide repeat protein [Teladorsagia circumcincta]|uniref:Tetratricopeptide repeat protein n=1 Tax=Teladorsagia circumcincta TaxID=45464 RepID=A0A2G9U1K2_TELCI|nr:tetratricopeptide repeat protein [Teladorsagia circumcincta]